MEENKMKGIGYGTTALVTGILSILFIQFIVVSTLLAIAAIVFGILGIKKGNKGLSKSGLILGIVAILITFLLYLFLEVLEVSLFTIPSWYL